MADEGGGDVKVPGMGSVPKKWIWIGLGTMAAFVAWSYYRKSQTPAPIEEAIDGADVAVGDSGVGNVPGKTGDSSGSYSDDDVISTPAEWTAFVVPKLVDAGWEANVAYAAIGRWLAGETLTDQEKTLIQAAKAIGGEPPGGPYPIKTAIAGTPPAPNPPAPATQAPEFVSVPLNTDLEAWIAQLNGQYPGLGLSWGKFMSLNDLDGANRKYWHVVNGSPQFFKWHPTLGIPPLRIR